MFGVIRMVTGHGNKLLLGVRFFFQPRYHTTPGRIFQPLLQFFYRIIAILHKGKPLADTKKQLSRWTGKLLFHLIKL